LVRSETLIQKKQKSAEMKYLITALLLSVSSATMADFYSELQKNNRPRYSDERQKQIEMQQMQRQTPAEQQRKQAEKLMQIDSIESSHRRQQKMQKLYIKRKYQGNKGDDINWYND